MSILESANPVMSLWILLPISGASMLLIASHIALVRRAPVEEMPESRRRIRSANGVLLLAITMLLTYALGYVGMLPSGGGAIGHVRAFVVVWMVILALVPVVLLLAAMDMVDTARKQRDAARVMRAQLRGQMLRDVEITVKARLAARAAAENGAGGAGDDADAR